MHHDFGPLGAAFSPRAMERQLELQKKLDEVEKVTVAGPGFINFFLKPEVFADVTEPSAAA